MRIFYQLKTIDPVIISQTNATTNNHNTLDFIPGSAILGAVAANLYKSLDPQLSWQLFHGSDAQFGPCYPQVNGEIALPIPSSWHIEKGEQAFEHHQLNNSVINIDSIDYDRGDKQYQQLRQGFISSHGQVAEIKLGQITKTALDNETGTVAKGQLYSYSFIEKDQSFIGWVDVPEDHKELVSDALRQVKRIGRAKNSEFGRVKVSLIKGEQPQVNAFDKQLVLWCLSDCEFVDEYGNNTCQPSGHALGKAFQSLTLNTQQSYIRSHTVSRFNQKRASFDSQTRLVTKGSILVFDNADTLTASELQQLNELGIGINKQHGQGWVNVNPLWWQANKLPETQLFTATQCQILTDEAPSAAVDTLLMQWVKSRVSISDTQQQYKKHAHALLADIQASYANARSYNALGKHLQAGPSANQWRRIYERVKHTGNQWQEGVFIGKHRICNSENDELGWGISWQTEEKLTDFETHCEKLLSQQSGAVMGQFLELLCQFDASTFTGLKKLEQFIEKQGGQ